MAIVILVAVGWFSYRTTTQFIEDSAWVAHTHQVLEKLTNVLSQLQDAETGQRGYLLTGEEQYLEPYEAALARERQAVADLRRLTADNPRQQQQLDALEPLVEEKLAELKETIDLRREKGFAAAVEVVLTERGKKVMDQARRVIAEMEKEERTLLAERDAQARARARNTILTLILGEILSVALLLLVFYLLNREISERKQAQEARQRQLDLNKTITDNAASCLFMMDRQGHPTFMNPVAEKVTGYTLDEIKGKPLHDAVHYKYPDGRPYPMSECPIDNAQAQLVEMKDYQDIFVRKDGSLYPVICYIAPLEEGGKVVGSVLEFRDVTEQKRLERHVQERTAELEATNKELEAFTYSVSHDLRAPLRQVDGFANVLVEELGPKLEPGAQHHLQRIQEGARHMGQLVDDLLNLARLGRRELAMQVTGLDSLVKEVLAELKPETEDRDVEWRIGQLPFADCDPALMKQALANLLSNALKYTRPRPRAVIEVGQTMTNGQPAVFVRDNGVGFNMKYADKLFGVFQRLHRAEDFEGTGVGLATVQRILHKHGGRVWAEAELDQGATFYFTLRASESGGAERQIPVTLRGEA